MQPSPAGRHVFTHRHTPVVIPRSHYLSAHSKLYLCSVKHVLLSCLDNLHVSCFAKRLKVSGWCHTIPMSYSLFIILGCHNENTVILPRYVPPEQAKVVASVHASISGSSNSSTSSTPEVRPLKSLLGETAPSLHLNRNTPPNQVRVSKSILTAKDGLIWKK